MIIYLIIVILTILTSSDDAGGDLANCTKIQSLQKQVWGTTDVTNADTYIRLMFPKLQTQIDIAPGNKPECGTGSKTYWEDNCVQIHLPDALFHEQDGLKVGYVEKQFNLKWKNIQNNINNIKNKNNIPLNTQIYDSFFDYNYKMYTKDISIYDKIWETNNIERIYLKWKLNGENYYSMIGILPNSQAIFELISNKFSDIKSNYIILNSETRTYFDSGSEPFTRSDYNDWIFFPIGISRSVKDIRKNIKFFKTIFSATIQSQGEGNYLNSRVKYCHLILSDGVIVSLYERHDSTSVSSYGDLSIDSYINRINKAHNDVMINQFCGFDRWFDNHAAIATSGQAAVDILDTLQSSIYKYIVYTVIGKQQYFVYILEPNGYSIQLILDKTGIDIINGLGEDWDGEWCPMSCTSEEFTYTWGDTTFLFNQELIDEIENSKNNNIKNSISQNKTKNIEHKNKTYNELVALCMFVFWFIALSIRVYYFHKNNKINDDKINKCYYNEPNETTSLLTKITVS